MVGLHDVLGNHFRVELFKNYLFIYILGNSTTFEEQILFCEYFCRMKHFNLWVASRAAPPDVDTVFGWFERHILPKWSATSEGHLSFINSSIRALVIE